MALCKIAVTANALELLLSCTKPSIFFYSYKGYYLHYGLVWGLCSIYCKTFYISRTLVGNKIIGNSDVVGASPVGAAPTTSSFST